MTLLLHCYEPDAQPPRVSLALEAGETASLFLLQGPAARDLRSTVLRTRDGGAPPDAMRVCDVDVSLTGAGAPQGRVRAINARLDVVVLRGETRSRAVADIELRGSTRLEVTLPDGRTLPLALEVAAPVRQGARQSTGSGRSRSLEESAKELRSLWVIPRLWDALEEPRSRLKGGLSRGLPQWVRSRAFQLAATTLLVGGAAVLTRQSGEARVDDAVQQAERARAEASTANANLSAALMAEQACTTERRRLAVALEQRDAERAARVDRVLALASSRARAIARGGRSMQSPDLLAWDALAAEALRAAVTRAVLALEAQPAAEVSSCLEQAPRLGSDLPRYDLLWHGDPARLCTADYADVSGGVDRAGRWGLSRRAATAFGAPLSAIDIPLAPLDETEETPLAETDMRANDVWSASALAAGLRAVETSLLLGGAGERPAVAPAQIHLWSLALWASYNQMPSPAGGARDGTLPRCIGDGLRHLAAARGAARPGEPLLPGIAGVLDGDAPDLVPTAACPWPPDALASGARAAISAVARAAVYDPDATAEAEPLAMENPR